MAKRKKKRQKERVLEPLVKPGKPIKTPARVPSNSSVTHTSAGLDADDTVFGQPGNDTLVGRCGGFDTIDAGSSHEPEAANSKS